MTKKPDGGPIHPNNGPSQHGTTGMSLRDYFAGQALANARTMLDFSTATPADIALQAYGLADAMIEEREHD